MKFVKWNRAFLIPVLFLSVGLLTGPASAEVIFDHMDWITIGGTVEFHAYFRNLDTENASGPVDYELNAQPYGAFVPSTYQICAGTIPSIPAGLLHEVICSADLADLPASAEVLYPGGAPSAPGLADLAAVACPPIGAWNGNVDVFFIEGVPVNVGVHYSTIYVCPGAGPTYVHALFDCQDAGGLVWSFSNLCPGWSGSLVYDNAGSPGAPVVGPIPPGFFDGWICISADASVNVGDLCSPTLDLMCGGQTATVTINAEACDWAGPTPVEKTTWGDVKRKNLTKDN
jgi:hypothetical protein